MPGKKETEQLAEELLKPIAEEFGVRIYDVEYVKEGSDYFLTYIAGEIQYPIALSSLADGIYKTEEKLEPAVLALSNAHFTVRAYLDET